MNAKISTGGNHVDFGDRLLSQGYSAISLGRSQKSALHVLAEEAQSFFLMPESEKNRYACPEFHFGFRPFGRQYSVQPDRPDLNESFTYWSDEPAHVPNFVELPRLTTALHSYWKVVSDLSRQIMEQLGAKFSYGRSIDIERASYIEINWYRSSQSRDLLQDRHEDGHLLTLVWADSPGLEIESENGGMRPVDFRDDELIAMPGNLMTAMTAGAVQPLYHQVRNMRLARRLSVLFLVNPPFDEDTSPFILGSANRDANISELAKNNGRIFGLPPAPKI